jgi:hypothetical protein
MPDERIELPSMLDAENHNWVCIRTNLKASDRFEVQKVAKMTITGEANLAAYLEMENDMRNALLGRIITDWSYPVPIPSKNDFAAADRVIGDVMDLDDYSVLEQAVDPLMAKISGRVTRDPKRTATG